MRRHRHYAARGVCPDVAMILAARREGTSMAAIAETHGVHRRTVYVAVDRAADEGRLSPDDSLIVYGDQVATRRLARRVVAAYRAGLPVTGWTPSHDADLATADAAREARRQARDALVR